MNRKIEKIEKLINEIQGLLSELKEEKSSIDRKTQTDCPVRKPLISATVENFLKVKEEETRLSELSKELFAVENLKNNNDILKDTVKQLKDDMISVGEGVILKREKYRATVEKLSIEDQN